jgi:glyoxylase-like metal-dependent hydrolase (beta-lactamase superfamily II)
MERAADLAVYCLNVGQGNCCAIIDPSPEGRPGPYQAVLIDLGVDGARLVDWLREVNVRYIPLIALSHNDRDHIVGLEEVVRAFRRRVGQLLFVPDRPTLQIPFWLEADEWARQGLIDSTGQLTTPRAYRPGMGVVLLGPPQVSYRLHCLYPDLFQHYAAVHGAGRAGTPVGHGPNATSAILGLSRTQRPEAQPRRMWVLFGGDLDFPGWRCLVESRHRLAADVLVAPHHGAPRGATADFGQAELVRAIKPQFVVFSVGTRQRHVQPRTEATARHPHPETVRAVRAEGATVLCTQITRRCVDEPERLPGGSVMRLPLVPALPDLSPSGVGCAGTVVITIPDRGRPSVLYLGEHQDAVDQLQSDGHHPMCRG